MVVNVEWFCSLHWKCWLFQLLEVKAEEILIESTGLIGQRIKKVCAEILCIGFYNTNKIQDKPLEKSSNKLTLNSTLIDDRFVISIAGGTFKLASQASEFTIIFSWGVIPIFSDIVLLSIFISELQSYWENFFFVVIKSFSSHSFFKTFLPIWFLILWKILCSFISSSNLISLHTGQILQQWQSLQQILLARVWQLSLWYYSFPPCFLASSSCS